MKIEIEKDVICMTIMIIHRRTNSREKKTNIKEKIIQIKTQRKQKKSRENEMIKFMIK